MIGDLHLHTRHSDGSGTVRDVLIEAKTHGLSYVSLVDHDTTAGLAEAIELGGVLDLTVVPGVEISAMDPVQGGKVHILGYGFEQPATHIESLCEPLLRRRHEKTRSQIECLQQHGYEITVDEVRAMAQTGSLEAGSAATGGETNRIGWPENPALYKQHIMAVLVEKGYCDEIYSELYRELFKGDGPCAGDIQYVDAFDAVRAVVADGGIAVLAHPGQQDSYHLVPDLVGAGLRGIELYHEDNGREDHRRIRALADQYNLILTGGSDDHGTYGSSHVLGEIVAPHGSLERLVSRGNSLVRWAERLVREAGEMARRGLLSDIETELKGGDIRDLVTHHDREIDRFLTDSIAERYPDHGFITEEHDHPEVRDETPVWIIDPIDGTTNFVSSRGYFAISLAHYSGGEPVFGIVYDVMAEELYLGISGEGAYLNGRRLDGWSAPKALEECVVETSLLSTQRFRQWYGASPDVIAQGFRAQRAYGCASLGICRIARGVLDVYIASSLSLWDYAAGIVVLQEAGGQASITVPPGAEASRFHSDRRGFFATGHADTLQALVGVYFDDADTPELLLLTDQ